MVRRTNNPALSEFAQKLDELGKDDLYEIFVSSSNVMENLRGIADKVGFDEYPSEGERKDVYLNKIWPYIMEYEK